MMLMMMMMILHMGHIIAVCQFPGIFSDAHIFFISVCISSHNFLSPDDLLHFDVLIISHTSSFARGFNLLFRSLIHYFFVHIILPIKSCKKYCFQLSIINRSFPLTNRCSLLETGLHPASYCIEFSHIIAFICFLHNFQHF